MAIWKLISSEDPMYPATPNSKERIDKILELAVEDYEPGCGDKIVLVLDFGDNQNILITYPLPCYPEGQEETAWGQGCLFTEKGSWAMYFTVCK